MANCFQHQTHVATLDIGLNIFLYRQLVGLSDYQLLSLLYIKVAYKGIIIVLAYQLWANDFWDIQKALIIEHFFNILSAL